MDSPQQRPNPGDRDRPAEAGDNYDRGRNITTTKNTKNDRRSYGGARFKGKCEDLGSAVYDVGYSVGTQDLYNTTTKEIAEYAARNYDDAGEFRPGLVDSSLPAILPLRPPASDDLAAVEMHELDSKVHRERPKKRNTNCAKIYAPILGQCSRTVRDRVEASAGWSSVNNISDVIGLPKLIRQCMYTKAMNQHPTVALLEAESALHQFCQMEKMSNSEFPEKLKSLAEVVEHLGGQPVIINMPASDAAKDYENLEDEDDIESIHGRIHEDYLAVMLILKSDRQ